jgi:ATP-dependent helicase HrpA
VTTRAKAALAVGPYESTADWAEDCMSAAVDRIVERAGGPAWEAVGFDRLLREVKDRLDLMLSEIAESSLDVLEALWAAGLAAEELPDNDTYRAVITDVQTQLDQVVFDGFITVAGAVRLPDIARYLLAVEHRLDRVTSDPDRDATLMTQAQTLEAEHARLVDALGATPALIDIAWMLQELRVSLFAQQLGTNGTVSPKRVRRALAEAMA